MSRMSSHGHRVVQSIRYPSPIVNRQRCAKSSSAPRCIVHERRFCCLLCRRQTGLDLLLAVGLKPDALTMEVVREIVQYFEAAKIWMPEVGSESAGAELTPAQAGVLGMSSEEVASRRAMAAGFKSTVRAGKGT